MPINELKELENLLIEWGKSSCDIIMPDMYLYSKNQLNEKDKKRVEMHLKFCSSCKRALNDYLSEINPLTSKVNDSYVSSRISILIEKLKAFIPDLNSNLDLECFHLGFDTTRSPNVQNNLFSFGDEMIISLKPLIDGYITLIHYHESENIELLIPSVEDNNVFIKAHDIKEIRKEVLGPEGIHYLKAIYTSAPLLKSNLIDLSIEENILKLVEDSLEILFSLPKNKRSIVDYKFLVKKT